MKPCRWPGCTNESAPTKSGMTKDGQRRPGRPRLYCAEHDAEGKRQKRRADWKAMYHRMVGGEIPTTPSMKSRVERAQKEVRRKWLAQKREEICRRALAEAARNGELA